MKFNEQLSNFYMRPHNQLKMTYQQLTSCNIDIGFTSIIRNGLDFHQLTRNIALSVMRFQNEKLTNLVFSNGQPIRLELEDSEISSYFSDYIELRYILSGNLEVEIEGEVCHFNENDICFIDSMAYHKESIAKSNCVLLNISVEKDVFNEAFLSSVELSPLQQFLRSNIMKRSKKYHFLKFTPTTSSSNEIIQAFLSNIFFEVKNHEPGYLEISKGYIIRLMDHLSVDYNYNFNKKDTMVYNEKLFESITCYMNQHLTNVTLSDLTNEFHYQPNYFNNLIKKFTGLTYSHYLINLRIEHSKTLLNSTKLPIEEIMQLSGYNNKGFFYNKFKEFVGMSPAQYRVSSIK